MVKTPPRVYFSFRSPYSWLSFHDLRRDHPDLVGRLEWRPFWEPDERFTALLTEAGHEFPYTPMSRAKHFYLLRDVRRLARRRGLANAWPVDDHLYWEPAHLAWFAAADQGLAEDYSDRVYAARWLSGDDICRPEVVQTILDDLGIATTIDDLLRSPDIEKRALDALISICEEDIFGVPMFLRGREKFWGLDRLPDFLAALPDTAEGEPSTVPNLAVPKATAEIGHAGGCG